jgi:hypothetical protein
MSKLYKTLYARAFEKNINQLDVGLTQNVLSFFVWTLYDNRGNNGGKHPEKQLLRGSKVAIIIQYNTHIQVL